MSVFDVWRTFLLYFPAHNHQPRPRMIPSLHCLELHMWTVQKTFFFFFFDKLYLKNDCVLKERYEVFWGKRQSEEKNDYLLTFSMLHLNRLNRFPSVSWLNKQTELKEKHIFILFYLVFMWRTLPPSQFQTLFWGHYSPLRTACLFSYGNVLSLSLYYYRININIVNTVWISSPKLV